MKIDGFVEKSLLFEFWVCGLVEIVEVFRGFRLINCLVMWLVVEF